MAAFKTTRAWKTCCCRFATVSCSHISRSTRSVGETTRLFMAGTKVIDADGHIIERTDELRKYLKSPFNKRGGPLTASEPWDRGLQQTLPREPQAFPSAPSAPDWLRLLDDHNIEQAFLYPTALGNVSRIREREYAAALCQAYNDYVHDRYAKISNRLRPVALLPFQDPESAVIE